MGACKWELRGDGTRWREAPPGGVVYPAIPPRAHGWVVPVPTFLHHDFWQRD